MVFRGVCVDENSVNLIADESTRIEFQTHNYNPFVKAQLFDIVDSGGFYEKIKNIVDERESKFEEETFGKSKVKRGSKKKKLRTRKSKKTTNK